MRHCAFLRGVNIGRKSMKMAEVVKVFESAGMKDVSAVLATGNILFSSDKNPEIINNDLEKAMSEYFNYDCFMFIKNQDEISQIINSNPFSKSEDHHIYIFLTSAGTELLLLQEFEKSTKGKGEKVEIRHDIFYWHVAKGNTLDSDFGKILGKKAYKDKLTSRNLNTFEKIESKL